MMQSAFMLGANNWRGVVLAKTYCDKWPDGCIVCELELCDGREETAKKKLGQKPKEAQEPVKPLDENYWKHTMGRCGHCKAPLPAIEGLRSKFCWMCGKPVKWDG